MASINHHPILYIHSLPPPSPSFNTHLHQLPHSSSHLSPKTLLSHSTPNNKIQTPIKTSSHSKTPTTHDYLNSLNQSVRTNNVGLAKSVHASILKLLKEDDLYLSNYLIVSYFKLGQTHLAEKVFYVLEAPDVVSFTSMISGFAKSGRENEALKIFFEMRTSGIQPNEFTFVAVLAACKQVRAFQKMGIQIHCMVVKFGYVGYIYVGNSLMALYGECGLFDCAFDLFDEMPHRDVVSWNTVIMLSVRGLMYTRAFVLFHEMIGVEGMNIDYFSISSILAACAACCGFEEGRAVHGYATKVGLEMDLSVSNALIGFYTKCGSEKDVVGLFEKMDFKDTYTWTQMITAYMEFGLVELAVEVFDQMPSKNCVSYNALLAGFCQNGIGLRPLSLFCTMLEEGTELDHSSLLSVVKACGLYMEKRTSEQIHGFVLKFGLGSNDHVEAALLDMCTKCGRMADAEQMFQRLPLNQDRSIQWTSTMCGYARNGRPHEAISLSSKGHFTETVTVDEISSAAELSVCGKLGLHVLGEQIHCNAFKMGFQSELGVENALISMYSKCGNMKSAKKIFDIMSRRDIVSWNSLMAGYILQWQGDEAMVSWEEMKKAGLQPDSSTALLTISAYSHTSSNLVDDCRKFFFSLKTMYGIEPTSEHYAALVGVLGNWGLLEEAEEIIMQMPFEPDSSVWRALLDRCRVHRNTTVGKRAAKQILAMKPQDPSTYILVSNLYSASGRWQCSELTRKEMREKGMHKYPAQSWIIHQNKVHSFYARDKSHSNSKDIYSGLDILVLECLKAGYVPDTSFVLHEVEEYQKKDFLFYHSAKLAVTYGLLMTKPGTPIRVMKNITLCGDCHTFFKYVSVITKREIHMRDASGIHCFRNGQCSCKGYW